MRRHVVSVTLAICLLAAAVGCSKGERPMLVRVTGTEGVRFTGHYVLHSGGQEWRESLDQAVPFVIELRGSDVSCMAQKLVEEGTLRVEILVDGEPVAFDWTRDHYGHVSAATP